MIWLVIILIIVMILGFGRTAQLQLMSEEEKAEERKKFKPLPPKPPEKPWYKDIVVWVVLAMMAYGWIYG